jgi:hypothetical protein
MVQNGTAVKLNLSSVGDVFGAPDANSSGVVRTVAMSSASFEASYVPPTLFTNP